MEQVLCPVIVGRVDEQRALTERIEAAAGGRGSATFLIGESGVGKTRLARFAIDAARERNAVSVWGRAVAGGAAVAFRPLSEALHSALRDSGAPAEPELEPFLPVLGRLAPGIGLEPGPGEVTAVTVGEAMLRLLRALGRDHGAVMLLDDLHWADADTLAVVEYLVDNLGPEPVALVATLRDEEGSPALELVHRLRARHVAEVVALRALSPDAVAEMAEACLGGAALPGAAGSLLGSHADGMPFLVEELLAAMVDSGSLVRAGGGWEMRGDPARVAPLTFVDTVRRRLDVLASDARRVLGAAAVLGRNFDWSLLPAVTGLTEGVVLESLRSAIEVQLVSEDPLAADGFRFRHALTREAMLSTLLGPERRLLARAALQALEDAHPDLEGSWCELGADLAEQAGDVRRTAELLLEAGRRTVAAPGGALAAAIDTLDRARALRIDAPALTAEIEEVLADALALGGRTDRVFEVGEELLGRMRRLSAPPARSARVHFSMARSAVTATDWGLARSHLDAARGLLATDHDDELAARIEELSGEVSLGEFRLDDAVAHGTAALELAERHDLPPVACAALILLGRCARSTDFATAEQAYERAIGIAAEHGLSIWRARALHEVATLDLIRVGTPDRVRESQALAESLGLLDIATHDEHGLSVVCFLRFEIDEALVHTQRAQAAARRYRLGLLVPAAMIIEMSIAGIHRDRPRLDALADEALMIVDADPDLTGGVFGNGLALGSLAEDDRDRARRELDEAHHAVGVIPGVLHAPWRGLRALVHALDGDDGALAREERSAISVLEYPVVGGCLGLADAVAAGRRGDAGTAVDHAQLGDTSLGRTPWFRHVGRRLVAEAMVEDAWGDPVPWLREAIVFFDGHGNHVLAGACRDLLRRAGAPVPRRGRGESEVPPELRGLGVTSREVDVLRLVVEGLPNREIADRLYLSPRTVEKHVERLVAKTGVPSRAELAKYGVDLP
ncbi:MAG: ATP-binding protein [Acidimicrobiia bacterium]